MGELAVVVTFQKLLNLPRDVDPRIVEAVQSIARYIGQDIARHANPSGMFVHRLEAAGIQRWIRKELLSFGVVEQVVGRRDIWTLTKSARKAIDAGIRHFEMCEREALIQKLTVEVLDKKAEIMVHQRILRQAGYGK